MGREKNVRFLCGRGIINKWGASTAVHLFQLKGVVQGHTLYFQSNFSLLGENLKQSNTLFLFYFLLLLQEVKIVRCMTRITLIIMGTGLLKLCA